MKSRDSAAEREGRDGWLMLSRRLWRAKEGKQGRQTRERRRRQGRDGEEWLDDGWFEISLQMPFTTKFALFPMDSH